MWATCSTDMAGPREASPRRRSTRWSGRRGSERPPFAIVASCFAQMGPEAVSGRASGLARAFMDQGVTFDLATLRLEVVPWNLHGAECRDGAGSELNAC